MVRTNPTLRSLAVLAILLAVCCAGTAFMKARLSRPVVSERPMPTARVLWEMPAAGIRSISFSSSGRHISTVSDNCQVTTYDSTGTKRYETVVPGADRSVISPDGKCTMAYSHMNRANTQLTFLDANGRVHWQMNVAGAIWSADASKVGNETSFAVGTGSRYVYLVSIHGNSKRYRRWRAPGSVCSVSLCRHGGNVAYGTWQHSSVASTNLTGHRNWQLKADSASLHYVQSLSGTDRLFVRATPNRWNANGEVWLAESNGAVRNELPLCASEGTCALPSPDGNYICTGYTKSIRHSAKSTPERHVALYDSRGRKLWDKGSLLLQVTPVLVTRGGFVLLAGSKKAVLAVSPAGEVKQLCNLPAPVLSSVSTPDGLRALMTCADGKLRFLQVSL